MKSKYIRFYEFEELYDEFKPNEIIFDTQNQEWDYSPLRFYLTFSSIYFSYAPDTMFLRGASGEIALGLVKKVKIVARTEIIIEAVVICWTGISNETNNFKIILKK